MDVGLHALNRFGLGARPGERRAVGDGRDWLIAQLAGGPPSTVTPPATPDEIAETLRGIRAAAQGTERERQAARQRLIRLGLAEQRAALAERLQSERPFVERLVAFWSNHLCVSVAARQQLQALAGGYERDVIRRHVLGRFEDIVLASAQHPAMLFYLDNVQSIGPGSAAARRTPQGRGAQRGLNENYARELLELHTLGVAGGYTQEDVIELARALTGWTVSGVQGPGQVTPQPRVRRPGARAGARPPDAAAGPLGFMFQPLMHEPGARTLMGRSYRAQGESQARDMIRDLCAHPATARHVATRLVTHFVADEPPASAVDRVAARFSATGGDLRAVAETLVDLPEAWTTGTQKFRAPQDWLTAALRALDAPTANDALPQLLRQLGQPLWAPQSPKGFPDTAQAWADPDSLLSRAELARSLTRRVQRRALDPRELGDVVEVAAGDPLHALLADTAIPPDERAALLLAGPAFQWR